MEPGPSGSSGGGGGIGSMPEGAVQQMILSPIPGPSNRPYLAQPVQVPQHYLVPPEQLLPHQVRSGIDIGNLFKLLNALQNRIALACGQHQFLRDPLNQPRPPDDGAYKPLTPQAAVRDLRSLCRQQRNLMEKLRRWNCTNEGKCYDLVMNGTYTGICTNCEPFAASKIRAKKVSKSIRKKKAKARRKALKRLTASPTKAKQRPQKNIIVSRTAVAVVPSTSARFLVPPPPPCQPLRKRRKKVFINRETPHPETYLSQENFLSELGLVTPEVYQKAQAESRRTERRRRTTANPKYKSRTDTNEPGPSGTQKSQRSRRSDPSSLETPLPTTFSSPTSVERRRAKQKRYECTVCEKKDVTVECNRCMSGFHPECIRVTASKAPPPTTVDVCPNCVQCDSGIRSSDCILLSRRMSRPSIMGLKSDPQPRSGGNSSRSQKSNSRRRAAARNYSKSARRTAAKTKKPPFKPKIVSKPRKAASKKCYSKRTLNHSLAVAAAAAVPAYCTTARSSEERTLAQEKVTETQTQRKRKLEVPAASSSKAYKAKQATTTPPASERRMQLTKREASSTPLAAAVVKDVVAVKKTVPVKPLTVLQSEGRSNLVAKKSTVKPRESQDGVVSSHKNILNVGNGVQVLSAESSKTSPSSSQQMADTSNRNKKAEEKVVCAEAETPSKGATSKPKKTNGSKPLPLDPFCVKRTIMAMSAAAGLVMSNNVNKISNSSNPPSSPAPSTSQVSINPSQKVIEPAQKTPNPLASLNQMSTANPTNHEFDNGTPNTTEAKVNPVHKIATTTALSPVANANSKSCETDTKKSLMTLTENPGKNEACKPASGHHTPMSNMNLNNNSFLPSKQTSILPIQKIGGAARDKKTVQKEKVQAWIESRGKNMLKVPKPAIISNLVALKNKNAAIGIKPTQQAEARLQKVENTSPILLQKSSSFNSMNTKVTMVPSELNGKTVQSPTKSPILSNNAILKNKIPEATLKTEELKVVATGSKTIRQPPKPTTNIQQSNADENFGNKKAGSPKTKKAPKPIPKMDPAVEQSVIETIERVIKNSICEANGEEAKINKSSPLTKKSYDSSKIAVSCGYSKPETFGNVTGNVKTGYPDKWDSSHPSDDYAFSHEKFLFGNHDNDVTPKEPERSASPASNSSTIGSPRSLGDLSDSSDDLLSIPDTPLAPYLELKRLEAGGPFLDLSAIDRLNEFKQKQALAASKRGGRFGSGRGRGGRF